MTTAACTCTRWTVALLAEGVDRNGPGYLSFGNYEGVALLAEGVDRNVADLRRRRCDSPSPSSRRAWIEIRPG